MKILRLVAAAAMLIPACPNGGLAGRAVAQSPDDDRWGEVDVIERTVKLAPGAAVSVSTIYGPVEVETVEGDTAEVRVERTARRREDFATRPVFVDGSAGALRVRGERDTSQEPMRVRHHVRLRVPRRVALSIEMINGRVGVGDVDGPVELHRINGATVVAGATGRLVASRINGTLTASVAWTAGSAVELETINGAVELRLAGARDLDVSVDKYSGEVRVDLPNVTVLSSAPREVYRARVGSGGPAVSIHQVNGSVRILSER